MKWHLNYPVRDVIFFIGILFMLSTSSCSEKDTICMNCHRIKSGGGVVPGTETRVCGEESIQRLRKSGYKCF